MISRTLTWKIYAYISDVWVDISSDVLIGGGAINARWGIMGNAETDRMAETGILTFSMNNVTGKYSPDLSGAMAGWKKGTPIKLVFTFDGQDYTRFRGRIDNLVIDAGTRKKRRVLVSVTDWLDYASEFPLDQLEIMLNRRADQAIETIINKMPIQPASATFDDGDNTFPVVFNTLTENTRAYSEITKLVLSEMGYFYLQKDASAGELLVFEAGSHRSSLLPVSSIPKPSENVDYILKEDGDAILKEDNGYLLIDELIACALDNVTTDLNVMYGSNIINSMQVTAYPKEVDASATTVLFNLNQPIMLASGETQIFTARYTDPSGGGRRVNGMNMVTPVAITDYLFNTVEAGTGSNITTSLQVDAKFGAESVTYTLTNNHTGIGYVTFLQARGKGIYNYNPISYTAEHHESQLSYGVYKRTINQPYQVTLAQGQLAAEGIVQRERDPRTDLKTVHFVANVSDALMLGFLNMDIGDVVSVTEDQTGINGEYFINGVEFTLYNGQVVRCRWHVKFKPTVGKGITLMACEFSPAGAVDALECGIIPQANNLTQRTLSAWIYAHSVPDTASSHIFGAWSGNILGYDIAANYGTCVHFQYSDGGAPGQWKSPDNSLPLNSWVHVAATRDTSSSGTVAPIIYIGGTAQVLTEAVAPAAGTADETGFRYILGNIYTAAYLYNRPFDGLIKDARIYNRILSADEVASLAAGGTVTSGMIFQGPAVYDGDVTTYTDKTLTVADKAIDAVYYRALTPHGEPIMRAIT